MKKIIDNIFGELFYACYVWERKYSLFLFGAERKVGLVVEPDNDDTIREIQYAAFQAFELNKSVILGEVERQLFNYYISISPALREELAEYDDDINGTAPIINNLQQLGELIGRITLIFMDPFEADERHIGIALDVAWDPELGAGIKLINEKIVEIGSQDIVL